MQLNLQSLLDKVQKVKGSRLLKLQLQNIYNCFIGATGASKSSLISYMLDYSHMTYEKKGLNYLLSHQGNASLPKIGNTSVSETELPELFVKGDINFVDLPGLFDTKGPEQELVNSYTSSLLFNKDYQFRFVIVVEVSSLYDRKGGKLAELIVKMEEMFGDSLAEIAKSTCLVISKVNESEQNEEELINELKEIVRINSYLPENSARRTFLDSLIDTGKVYFFSIPKQLTPEKIIAIENSIIFLPSFQLKKGINFSPSEESKKRLQEMINIACSQLKEKFSTIGTKIKGRYMRTYWQLQEAENWNSNLTAMELTMRGIKNWKEYNFKTILNKLDFQLEEAALADNIMVDLKKLSDNYPEVTVTYDANPIVILEALSSSKSHTYTEIVRIKNQMEVERIRRQNQIREENDRRWREEQLRRARQESQRRAREEQERIQREEAARRAQYEAQQRRQEEERRAMEQRIQQEQAARNACNQGRRRRRKGCEIM